MINFQPTDPYVQAAMNAAVNRNQQLENGEKSQQAENNLLIFELSGEMFSLITKCEMEKELLPRSNGLLKMEIAQLERQYAAELDTSPIIKIISEMVVARIQDIELTFQRCKNEYSQHYHSDKVSEFAVLKEKVIQLVSVEIKEALRLEETQDEGIIVLEKAILSMSNALILGNIEPKLKGKIEALTKKYEVLENDVSPLRLENQTLTRQKERIVEIHKENLKNRDQDSPIKKILDEVVATNDNLVWDQLAKVNPGACCFNIYSPRERTFKANEIQRKISDCVTLAQIQMVSLIETLKVKTKEGTKS